MCLTLISFTDTEIELLVNDIGSDFQLILSALLLLSLQALSMVPIQAIYVPHLVVLQQVTILIMVIIIEVMFYKWSAQSE